MPRRARGFGELDEPVTARVLELGRQVPPLTTFAIAAVIEWEFPNLKRVRVTWRIRRILDEGGLLDGVSRVGNVPTPPNPAVVRDAIERDKQHLKEHGRLLYHSIDALCAETKVSYGVVAGLERRGVISLEYRRDLRRLHARRRIERDALLMEDEPMLGEDEPIPNVPGRPRPVFGP